MEALRKGSVLLVSGKVRIGIQVQRPQMDLEEEHFLSSCDMSDNVPSLPSMTHTLIVSRPERTPV